MSKALAVDTYIAHRGYQGFKFSAVADPDAEVDHGWAKPRTVAHPLPRHSVGPRGGDRYARDQARFARRRYEKDWAQKVAAMKDAGIFPSQRHHAFRKRLLQGGRCSEDRVYRRVVCGGLVSWKLQPRKWVEPI
jgi:hypothetical protein